MHRVYLEALRVAQTPLKTRLVEAIRSKIGLSP